MPPHLARAHPHRLGHGHPSAIRKEDVDAPAIGRDISPFDVEMHGRVGGEVAQRIVRKGRPERDLLVTIGGRRVHRLYVPRSRTLDETRERSRVKANVRDHVPAGEAGKQRRSVERRVWEIVQGARPERLAPTRHEQFRDQRRV